jgi:hypothetical protein
LEQEIAGVKNHYDGLIKTAENEIKFLEGKLADLPELEKNPDGTYNYDPASVGIKVYSCLAERREALNTLITEIRNLETEIKGKMGVLKSETDVGLAIAAKEAEIKTAKADLEKLRR